MQVLDKECTKCGEVKKLEDFWKGDNGRYGYRSACKICTAKQRRQYYLNNKEKELEQNKKWRSDNKEFYRNRMQKYRLTAKGQINSRINRAIQHSLKKNKGGSKGRCKWESLTGYNANDLKAHLEKLFIDTMSWEAFVNGGIHIDHIRPISSFKYVSIMDEQFRQCWALDNLQPLWARDNISKSNKYESNTL